MVAKPFFSAIWVIGLNGLAYLIWSLKMRSELAYIIPIQIAWKTISHHIAVVIGSLPTYAAPECLANSFKSLGAM